MGVYAAGRAHFLKAGQMLYRDMPCQITLILKIFLYLRTACLLNKHVNQTNRCKNYFFLICSVSLDIIVHKNVKK